MSCHASAQAQPLPSNAALLTPLPSSHLPPSRQDVLDPSALQELVSQLGLQILGALHRQSL